MMIGRYKMRILFISNIGLNRISSFSLSSIYAGKLNGYEFHIAANWKDMDMKRKKQEEKKYSIIIHQVPIERFPISLSNIKAFYNLKKIIIENKIDVIHCNTPVGGMLGRLLGKYTTKNKVLYMAHGLHYYEGAPILNNTLYKYVEKKLAKLTDGMILINREDFNNSKLLQLRNNGKKYYVPGVGIDLKMVMENSLSEPIDNTIENIRKTGENKIIISVGELNKNKNNIIILKALNKLRRQDKLCYHYLVCGEGPEIENLKKFTIDNHLSENVHFLGYRTDIMYLLKYSDIFVLSSFREGLSRSLMEAMALEKPCLASRIRGNIDLIQHGKGGFLFNPHDENELAYYMQQMLKKSNKINKMGQFNGEKIKNFDLNIVIKKISQIYKEVFE